METNEQKIAIDDLRTIDELAAEFPSVLNVPLLRWQLNKRDRNGLSFACVKMGKRVLISKTRYEQWIAAQAGK